ncbi:MAG: hypothetical protein ACREFZ_06240, partial [Acetobacteraceae bacterium]
ACCGNSPVTSVCSLSIGYFNEAAARVLRKPPPRSSLIDKANSLDFRAVGRDGARRRRGTQGGTD